MAKPTRCARCGRENDPSLVFCLDCGQPLGPTPARAAGAVCASCGAALQPGFRFCGICGRPVAAPPPHVPGVGPPGTAPAIPPPLPRPAPPPRFRLTLLRSDGRAGATFPLEKDEVVCGRGVGEVRLGDDPAISPRHARFTRRGDVLSVEDLGSLNGTFLRLREPRRIALGEEIRVGRQLLRLEPLPPPPAADRGVRAWGTRDAGCRYRLSQLLEGGGVGDVFPLRDGENAIGREGGDVTFPTDRYVSARHAMIGVAAGEITLGDAGSSNGTFVKIAGATDLSTGDQVLVGGQILRVDA